MRKFRSCTATLNACMYSQSPASTHFELPHCVFAAGRPRRVLASSIMSSCTRVAVWMISTTAPRQMAERSSWGKSLAASSSNAGRILLPPPARRCSPMSVIARTFETVSRPNSRSIAARSSRSNSNISLTLPVAGELKDFPSLLVLAAVVGELHVDPEVVAFQQGNHLLQRVAVLAADSHRISLNRCLRLLLGILDHADNFLSLLRRDSLLHCYLLPCPGTRCRFNCPVCQALQRHAAFHQFALENLRDCLELELVGRAHVDGILAFQLNL